ncbi:hypothetical protein G7Y89_g13885 [Cudoniella acicularis]|uniref:DM13 domain-containing protein n=1 Tax=Cudoniella acicularis TaxID=354080 RepID=A0A8H4R8F5_9HELO|nr:hypothetical protein G7Y89_g13885 [Cudoniella acicularis]
MFKSAISVLAIAAFSTLAVAQNSTSSQKIGWSGTLSSLDGGLGGVVTVVNANTLQISSYTLKDASAPALYWWGTTDGVLKDGFRISNTHITTAATSNMLTINLDAGHTTADFSAVGLWCEQLNANFGQATLAAPSGSATGASAGAPSPTASAKSAAANVRASSYAVAAGAFMAAAGFAAWMV